MEVFNEFEFKNIWIYEKQIEYIKSHSNISWHTVLKNKFLSEEFLEQYMDRFANRIHEYQYLSNTFMENNKSKINWNQIGMYQNLSEEFILNNSDVITSELLENIIMYQKVSSKILDTYISEAKYIDWVSIITTQDLSEDFIEKHEDKINMDLVSKYQKLSIGFIEKHISKLDLDLLIVNNNFDDDFIMKYIKGFSLDQLLKYSKFKDKYMNGKVSVSNIISLFEYQKLNQKEIDKKLIKYKEELKSSGFYWLQLSRYQKLSEEFMNNNFSNLYLEDICEYQVLSKRFVKKYEDRFNTTEIEKIIEHQDFDTSFLLNNKKITDKGNKFIKIKNIDEKTLLKYKNYLDINYIIKNNKLSGELIKKYSEYFDMKTVYEYQDLSEEFIEEHIDDINWYLLSKNKNIKIKTLIKNKDKLELRVFSERKLSQYNDTEKSKKIKDEENENYFKIYKIFGNDNVLKEYNIQKSNEVTKLIKKSKLKNINYLSDEFINMNYKNLKNYIENIENIRKLKIEEEKAKVKQRERKEKREKLKSRNDMSNEIVF